MGLNIRPCHIGEASFFDQTAGVVDKDSDRYIPFSPYAGQRRSNGILICDIRCTCDSPATILCDCGTDSLGCVPVPEIIHGHGDSDFGEFHRDSCAYPARGAGHKCRTGVGIRLKSGFHFLFHHHHRTLSIHHNLTVLIHRPHLDSKRAGRDRLAHHLHLDVYGVANQHGAEPLEALARP